jgi:hypothetical protein
MDQPQADEREIFLVKINSFTNSKDERGEPASRDNAHFTSLGIENLKLINDAMN